MREIIKAALKGHGRKVKGLTEDIVKEAVSSLNWHFGDSESVAK